MYYYLRTIKLDDEGVEIILRETKLTGSHIKEVVSIKGNVIMVKQFIVSKNKLK